MQVGQEAVCIEDSCDNSNTFRIIKGQVYHILGIWKCNCHTYYDIGFNASRTFECVHCYDTIHDGIVYVPSKYFAPIQYNSAHDDLINKIKETKEEKLDAPIKEPEVANE